MHEDAPRHARALLINGTVGVGKTTVAEAVGDLLTDAEVPHAVLDLDWLSNSWPTPPGDRFNFAMLVRNLRSVAGHYLDAGATHLVLAGVIEEQAERKQLADAVGVDLTVCRLRAELPFIHQRLTHRHGSETEALQWHLHRSGELDGILSRAAVDDFTIDTGTGSVTDIALSVIRAAGWQ
ncbi:AAA family ATPase [Streptomyces xylophagus]|uniref:AAA family ATPase n=1 Tax=Streptomyces xylophagus TaxID=285514 RepID=UPI0005B85881|nr:AAA family ATPase [Streptomyces xylophagus]